MYKALAESETGVKMLTNSLKKEVEEKGRVKGWKLSNTKMIKKKNKPTAKDLRPIASHKCVIQTVRDSDEE